MEKTKLGISVCLLAFLLYLSGLVSSLVLFLIAGYILLQEQDPWLRKAAVKAAVIMAAFALAFGAVDILDELLGAGSSLFSSLRIFRAVFEVPKMLTTFLESLLMIVRTVVLIAMGALALKKKDVSAGPLDKLINKHMQA